MSSLDEDEEGEVALGESADAEWETTPDIPKPPSVKTFDDGGDFEGASDIEGAGDIEDASDVDSGTLRAFVVAVIYANAAVLFVALGPMVWYFEGWSRVGPVLLVAGLLAGARTYQTYRAWERSRDEAAEADTAEADTADDDSASDSVDPASDDDRDPKSPPEA